MRKAAIYRLSAAAALLPWAVCGLFADEPQEHHGFAIELQEVLTDSLDREIMIFNGDTIHTSFLPEPIEIPHYGPLTEADYREIAEELGVEPAAIHAVVEIETGKTRRGFYAEGCPIINFDLPVFRRAAARRGINLSKYSSTHPTVFSAPNIRKYGSQQRAQQARLDAALTIDSIAAIESTFWGMFQIGGFNWKLCGAESRADFVRRMQRSEYDQLRLFANYMRNTGLVQHLKTKTGPHSPKYITAPPTHRAATTPAWPPPTADSPVFRGEGRGARAS